MPIFADFTPLIKIIANFSRVFAGNRDYPSNLVQQEMTGDKDLLLRLFTARAVLVATRCISATGCKFATG